VKFYIRVFFRKYDIFINCSWVCHPVAVHIYTQTIHRTTQIQTNVEECGPCPVFASFTLAFAFNWGKSSEKTSFRVRKTSVTLQYTYYQKHPHITKPSQAHTLQNPLTHTHTHARARAHTHTTERYRTTNSNFIKIWRELRALCRKNFVYLWYFAEFFRMRIVSDSCGENQNKHFLFNKFLSKIVPFMR
jgi:hypothetical protein